MASLRVAKEAAKKTLAECGINSVPTDLQRICKHYGIKIESDKILPYGLAGFFSRSEDSGYKLIVLSANDSNRQLFTLAHEIGHFVLHSFKGLVYDINEPELVYTRFHHVAKEIFDLEMEANVFAAELLMPEQFLINDFELTKDPAILAEKYKVSETVMSFRLKKLGSIGNKP